MLNVESSRSGIDFDVVRHGEQFGRIHLSIPGTHNALNACAVIALALELGVPFSSCSAALKSFGGVRRRFETRGEARGVVFVDDYAHLPTEISAVLSSCTDASDSWTRVVAVFQPNRFNRMQHMSDAYADCFAHADHVVITDIYSSGTAPIAGVTGKLVVDAIVRAHPQTSIAWKSTRVELIQHLATELRAGDICISMGCGDIESFPDDLRGALK